VPPDRVAPPVPLGGSFDDVLFVDLDAETWSRGDVDHALVVVEHRWVGDVVKQVVARVVV